MNSRVKKKSYDHFKLSKFKLHKYTNHLTLSLSQWHVKAEESSIPVRFSDQFSSPPIIPAIGKISRSELKFKKEKKTFFSVVDIAFALCLYLSLSLRLTTSAILSFQSNKTSFFFKVFLTHTCCAVLWFFSFISSRESRDRLRSEPFSLIQSVEVNTTSKHNWELRYSCCLSHSVIGYD